MTTSRRASRWSKSALRDAVVVARYLEELRAKVAAQHGVVTELQAAGQDARHAVMIRAKLEGALAALEQWQRNAEISAESGASLLWLRR